MISDRDLVTVERVGSPVSYGTMPRLEAEDAVSRVQRPGIEWRLVPAVTCRCCGEPAWDNLRCAKHQGRNPCAAEGCTRTRAAPHGYRDDVYLCGEHWRAFVPPGSVTRRAFNRLARVARKAGYRRTDRWPPELEARWWRLWFGVIRRVRRAADGHIDQAAISRLFGWDDEGG